MAVAWAMAPAMAAALGCVMEAMIPASSFMRRKSAARSSDSGTTQEAGALSAVFTPDSNQGYPRSARFAANSASAPPRDRPGAVAKRQAISSGSTLPWRSRDRASRRDAGGEGFPAAGSRPWERRGAYPSICP
jgi:hypothetical protein